MFKLKTFFLNKLTSTSGSVNSKFPKISIFEQSGSLVKNLLFILIFPNSSKESLVIGTIIFLYDSIPVARTSFTLLFKLLIIAEFARTKLIVYMFSIFSFISSEVTSSSKVIIELERIFRGSLIDSNCSLSYVLVDVSIINFFDSSIHAKFVILVTFFANLHYVSYVL